ncbi:MAG: hypothetical protein ACTSVV_05715 [Promethearchaeota archaeon]
MRKYLSFKKSLFFFLLLISFFHISIIPFINYGYSDKIFLKNNYYYIKYESNFYFLYFNKPVFDGKEHFDCEYYNLRLTIKLFNNSLENIISFKLQLISKLDPEIIYSLTRNYSYNHKERAIYYQNNNSKLGVIPLFINKSLSNDENCLIAKFRNESIYGIYKEKSGYLELSGYRYAYNYVLIDDTYGNYTAYYYSDYGNALLYWEIGNRKALTLKNIFSIRIFSGDIWITETNLDLKQTPINYLEKSLPNIILIIILTSILIFVFITVFLLIRRKLKLLNKRKRGVRRREKYPRW